MKYPTLVTFGTGEVLALSGYPSIHDIHHNHHIPERFTSAPAPGRWTLLSAPGANFEIFTDPKIYPRIHLLPNGQVFCSTPLGTNTAQSQVIDPSTGARSFSGDAPPDRINRGEFFTQEGTSVLLPLLPSEGYRARILLCGAAQPKIMHLGGSNLHWQPTAPRQLPASPPRYGVSNPQRNNATAILLPTGDVFVCGGTAGSRVPQSPTDPPPPPTDPTAVLESEIYHPSQDNQPDRWESLPAASVIRNYHSVALLLPDGRVWTAGSDHNAEKRRENLEPRIEILNPPYAAGPGRPEIDETVAEVSPAALFVIKTRQAGAITRVAMLRTGSVTHSFHSDQRYIGLKFTAAFPELVAAAPPNHNIAPPGYYLLFIIDQDGLPSKGRFIHLL
jgi:Domain of unknown function (DUF1929)